MDELWRAAWRGNAELVDAFLKLGHDPNNAVVAVVEAESTRWTPLQAAAARGHDQVVSVLLASPQVQANQADSQGSTPLFLL